MSCRSTSTTQHCPGIWLGQGQEHRYFHHASFALTGLPKFMHLLLCPDPQNLRLGRTRGQQDPVHCHSQVPASGKCCLETSHPE